MIDVAYLRVYRPAAEVHLPVAEAWADVPRMDEAVLTTESQTADAWEVEWDGELWRCPRTPRRRMLESLVAHQQATERYGVGMITRRVADAAKRELSHIRTGLHRPAPVMASAWHPPLRWFMAFGPDDDAGPMCLRTRAHRGGERLDRVVDAMRRAGLPEMWTDEVSLLADWVATFGDDSMLELDYRAVARHLDCPEDPTDSTIHDVAGSVQALDDGDLEASMGMFAAAMRRWAQAQAIGYSS